MFDRSSLLALTALAISTTGCATVFASKRDKVYITPPPGTTFTSVSVTDNGEPIEASPVSDEDLFVLDHLPKGTYYVELTSKDEHSLTITDGGHVTQMRTSHELAIGWLFLNLFTTGPIGITVDWITHAWRRQDPLILRLPARGPVAKRGR